MSFTLFDFIVIVIVLISAVLAMVRGFVREVLSIISWVVAAAAAYFLYEYLLGLINPSPIEDVTLATIISVAVIFIVVLIIATYITMKIADAVIDSRIGALDRLFGFLFGVVRGLLLVVIAFAFFTWLVPLNQPPWIANAQSTPFLTDLRDRLVALLPEDWEETLMEGFRGADEDDTPTPAETVPPAEEPGNNLPGLDRLLDGAPEPAPAPQVPQGTPAPQVPVTPAAPVP
ncbi:MAG: CvpA family protein [Bauldia sp.]